MDHDEFRYRGKEMIEYICGYMENLETRRVTPNIEPGYLRKLLPEEAPENSEDWDKIMEDVESKIMPGVTHWQHPRFHAYFPSGNSYPSILGDMLSAGIGCIGFSWASSPALTELETIVLDWLGKAIGLPDQFLAFTEGSRGGGVIQTSASECVLVSMLAARAQALKRLKQQHPFVEEGLLLSKLMAYCSREAHSCVEKAAMICFVKLRILEPDEKSSLRGKTLMLAMEEDETMGLIPFFVSTTLGTTACCAFDNLPEIGQVCRKFPCVWLHVDGAYAGNAFICPELKYLLAGIEYADSFNTNPNKWLLTNFDCSTYWVRDRIRLTSALVVDPLYLQHGYSDATIDYRHWGVPLSRRFRSLKLWFVLRSYGLSGLQKYIRNHIRLAQRFEELVLKDKRFEICNEVKLALVCFRLKGSDKLNEKLLSNINASGKLHMVPSNVNDKYVIRFCVVAVNAEEADIDHAWEVIREFADELLEVQITEKEQELHDKVFELLERKKKETLAHKRSFFVRMVSDPKIYNPSIAKSMPSTRRHLTEQADSPSSPDGNITVQPPFSHMKVKSHSLRRSASWISWPLAFLFQGITDDGSSGDVPIRFRHLDTKVRLKTSGKGTNGGSSSASPDAETSRSPKRSPASSRRSSPNSDQQK
ncbi:tyrosine decarboxylase 2 isoform X1 [Leptinotarsa decemlineata]|uniref:tyrosine decarboxylase 2 isoform X1 n=1 Tax=Leptinotarsa decemlineata TaxID=7539 RepID=UPI003D306C39